MSFGSYKILLLTSNAIFTSFLNIETIEFALIYAKTCVLNLELLPEEEATRALSISPTKTQARVADTNTHTL